MCVFLDLSFPLKTSPTWGKSADVGRSAVRVVILRAPARAVRGIYGGYFEDTVGRPVDGRRIEEESEIWESSYNSTVVVDFIRKTCIYECPDPQHSGA